jgi:hypothetical protein
VTKTLRFLITSLLLISNEQQMAVPVLSGQKGKPSELPVVAWDPFPLLYRLFTFCLCSIADRDLLSLIRFRIDTICLTIA